MGATAAFLDTAVSGRIYELVLAVFLDAAAGTAEDGLKRDGDAFDTIFSGLGPARNAAAAADAEISPRRVLSGGFPTGDSC